MPLVSEKRSQAARANGARSRGPITPAGKAISARNAMRHGLLANTIVLTHEEEIRFEALSNFHVARFSPVGDVEMSMIEEMWACYWRLRRTWAMETRILESGIANQPPGTPIEQFVGALRDAATDSRLALLHRYEARLHGMYQRAIKNIILRRKIPIGAPPLPVPPELPEQPEPLAASQPATQPATQPAPQHESNTAEPNEPRTPNVCTTRPALQALPKPPDPPLQSRTPFQSPPRSPAPTASP